MIRRAIVATLLAMTAATRAAAQPALPGPTGSPEFLSRFDFYISLAGLGEDDDRFSWDAHVGGDFDLVDYGLGRVTLLGEYQAVLGNQLQLFDPNQGNYTFAVSSSARVGATEFGVLFDHLSRHLTDRSKDFGIMRNVLAGQVMREFRTGRDTVVLRADAGKVVKAMYLDYSWIANADIVVRRQTSSRVGLFGRLRAEFYGVDADVAGRQDQQGGHVEGGVRLTGGAGAIELFAGYERVVDADPIEAQPRQWAFAGIRLIDR
jgi:hypothetical protein